MNRRQTRAAARNYTQAGPVKITNLHTGEKTAQKPYTPAEQLAIVGELGYRENPTNKGMAGR